MLIVLWYFLENNCWLQTLIPTGWRPVHNRVLSRFELGDFIRVYQISKYQPKYQTLAITILTQLFWSELTVDFSRRNLGNQYKETCWLQCWDNGWYYSYIWPVVYFLAKSCSNNLSCVCSSRTYYRFFNI